MFIYYYLKRNKEENARKKKRKREKETSIKITYLLFFRSKEQEKSDIDELKDGSCSIDSHHKQATWLQKPIESPQACAQQSCDIWLSLVILCRFLLYHSPKRFAKSKNKTIPLLLQSLVTAFHYMSNIRYDMNTTQGQGLS